MTSETAKMASSASNMRIIRDIADVQKGTNLSLAVAFQDSDVRHCQALIIGPANTPYQYGMFEFTVKFSKEYPTKPPTVNAMTTDSGRTRFNPNIYAAGKVCLSTLGTWPGDAGEGWSSAQSLESVLLSIQSLMSANPYTNEPGFEVSDEEEFESGQADGLPPPSRRTSAGCQAKAYVAKIHHETLRISVIQRMEKYFGITSPPPSTDKATKRTAASFAAAPSKPEEDVWEPFEDLLKRRFLWYYSSYHRSIDESIKQHKDLVKDGKAFATMPFEHRGNQMIGTFNYTNLKQRLENIKALLEGESEQWVKEGAEAAKKENPSALMMENELASMPKHFQGRGAMLTFEFIDKNPYHWKVIVFGNPMTDLDGGMFEMRLVFSTRFPEEQPRVTVTTPIFHHRVSPDGVLCYLPKKPENIKSHIEAAVEAIVGSTSCPDAWTVVHPEASELLWGDDEQKKQYKRRLRRSAQQSSDC